MAVAILGVLGLVVVIAAYLAGIAVGKLAASKERGEDPNGVRVSAKDIVGGARRHPARAS
jgi:hypothetical protein